MKWLPGAAAFLAVLLATPSSRAAEPLVRNRLHSMEGRWELGLGAALTPVTYLTRHTRLSLSGAYHLSEQFSFEVSGGWAFSSHTSVAEAASLEIVRAELGSRYQVVDDFEDLWRMTWSGTAAMRWAPVYGKLNLASELPVHFQAYLFAGGGVSGFVRDSLVYCVGSPSSRGLAVCEAGVAGDANVLTPLSERAIRPVLMGGLGVRLFLTQRFSVQLEARDLSFPDSYRKDIDRARAETDVAAKDGTAREGVRAESPGFTHLVFLQAGTSIVF